MTDSPGGDTCMGRGGDSASYPKRKNKQFTIINLKVQLHEIMCLNFYFLIQVRPLPVNA